MKRSTGILHLLVCMVGLNVVAETSPELNPVIPFLAITGRPTEADVEAKVAALKADGFDQFLVYARSGLQYRYMGEEWLRTVEACCREGQKRGMKVWLYDEFNWPSGTCKGRVPAADERFRYTEWAVYPKPGGGWRWEIVKAPAGWVNVCEPDAIKLFIKMTHEVYEKRLAKYFKAKVIPGIFSDEPGHPTGIRVGKDCRIHFRRWIGMEDEYRAATGRDFRADVEAFLVDAKAHPKAAKTDVWATYWRLMGRRFRTAYFDQIRAWCDKMDIVLTGHLIAESWVRGSFEYNGDPLLALKGESLPGMDEIFSNAAWGNGVGWDGGTEWLTLATVQHAAYRVKNGGLVELYACGPNDMSGARMRQMIWLCALHGVDHFLTSMQIMDHRGLVEKHGYLSPMQNGQPWHTELKPLFESAKDAARLARRQDVVRHAAVRNPLSATAHTTYNAIQDPLISPLLRAFGGSQLSVDMIAEDEKTDLPYVFEALADGTCRETRTGTVFKGGSAAADAAAWLRAKTAKSARFFEKDGKPAVGLVVREWSDGTVAAIDIRNSGKRELTLVRGGKRESVTVEPRGVVVSDGARRTETAADRTRMSAVVALSLPADLPYSLDRDPVFRLPFATNRLAKFTVKKPLKGVRLVLRTCAMSYAVTASGRPVDDGEGEPPDEQVLRHIATPYSFEFDGKRVAAVRPCAALPVEFRPLYGETEPFDLAPGEHTVRIVTGESDVNYFLPAAFVAGAFATEGATLLPLPKTLRPGAIAKQGLSGFCGAITYTLDDVARPQGDTLALNVGNAFARVKWNGADLGPCGWAPYEWKLPADGKAKGKLEVKVFTHVWNIFGDHERKDAKWDMNFWIPQHDADVAPGLYAAPTACASPKKLKVLMIGNSFSICVLRQLPQCVKSAGRELDLCSMYIGGCSLERHWQNAVAATNAAFTPYRVDWNYGGVKNGAAAPVAKVVKIQPDPWAKGQTEFGGNIPALLAADDWDVVTLQQASHFSWKPETYEPFGGNLVGLIRKLAPKAEIVVQETWSYTPFDKRLAQWGLTPETMYGKVRPTYAAFANKYGFRVIPTGAAVQHFRRTVPSSDGITGDPCGSPTGADKSHLNREGEYLQACVWFSTLYRRPASDITYRPDFLTEERAAQMRRSADAVSAPAIRVGTYNIRLQCGEPGTPDCWEERCESLALQIRKMNLDVFGMQEVCPGQLAYLKTALPEYEFVGDHREKDRKSGEASPVCYRKDRFVASKCGTFWLSETPEVPASKSWGTCCTRVCSYLVLTDRVTGKRFCFANTHTDHVSAEAREKGMLLIIERMKEFGKGCPIVFTGDHNCTENEKPAKSVAAILKNTLYETETPPAGCWRTWNGWRWLDSEVSTAEALKLPVNVRNIDNNDIGKAVSAKKTEATESQKFYQRCSGPRIDYIYVSPGTRVLDYATHSDARKGEKMYPSDHFPVSATIVL